MMSGLHLGLSSPPHQRSLMINTDITSSVELKHSGGGLFEFNELNGGGILTLVVSLKIQWKPFGLATQLHQQNDWGRVTVSC